jgi:hypothetical protein
MSNTLPDASDQRSLREAVDAYSDEIGEEQDPERVCGDDWNFYEDPHNRNN